MTKAIEQQNKDSIATHDFVEAFKQANSMLHNHHKNIEDEFAQDAMINEGSPEINTKKVWR